ncbi:sulfurtransferase complex subunit TusD [Buchnera aphidicola]|uniref:sulfurtransferase complex subunit TusD n=1 Tax=Buchnera aphidicola TaxID=9 RepID=UPI0030EC1B73
MIYTIIILGPPYGTQNSKTGFLFSKALIDSKHVIKKIFFYGEGILNSNINLFFNFSPEYTFCNIGKMWKDLSIKYSINLSICIGSCIKRGFLKNKNTYKKHYLKKNIASYFHLSNLNDLNESIISSDRVIQF